jgi:hydrogenase assembly chaperone HypC/HupF
MCLGSIAKVIEVHRDGRAIVEHDGVRQEVLEMTVADDDIEAGEWVLVHAGFALERLTEARALEALALRGKGGADTTEEAPS